MRKHVVRVVLEKTDPTAEMEELKDDVLQKVRAFNLDWRRHIAGRVSLGGQLMSGAAWFPPLLVG